MMLKTHLMITLFLILIFIELVEYQISFVAVALLATYIPDIDSRYSRIGQRKISRALQFFTKHRGVIHSFSFLIVLTFILALFLPVVALGFFLGYGSHLLADSFTVRGITPFWPYRGKSQGNIYTGHKSERIVLLGFIVANVLLLVWRVSGIF